MDLQRMAAFNKTTFAENKNINVAGFCIKINILFYKDNSWIVAIRQVKFGTVKDHKFYMHPLNMATVQNFEFLLG
jgi:hypothetical protein